MAKTKKAPKLENYEVEDAARTLLRAEEIKADPKLKAPVVTELKQQRDAATKLVNYLSPSRKK